jgi:hypothetical protein
MATSTSRSQPATHAENIPWLALHLQTSLRPAIRLTQNELSQTSRCNSPIVNFWLGKLPLPESLCQEEVRGLKYSKLDATRVGRLRPMPLRK